MKEKNIKTYNKHKKEVNPYDFLGKHLSCCCCCYFCTPPLSHVNVSLARNYVVIRERVEVATNILFCFTKATITNAITTSEDTLTTGVRHRQRREKKKLIFL